MKKMILLFSHRLSEIQIKQAKEIYSIKEFVSLPEELQNIWSNISPELETLEAMIKPIKEFLDVTAKEDDTVLIQGDFGAVFILVKYSQEKNLIPLYATTKRKVKEYTNHKGEEVKTSIFEHVRFREYGK